MTILRRLLLVHLVAMPTLGAGISLAGGCSSNDTAVPGVDAAVAIDAAADTGTDACVSAASATTGPADNHCAARAAQVTSAASCVLDAGATDAGNAADAADAAVDSDDGNDDASSDAGGTVDAADAADAAPIVCSYGTTLYGQSGDDDDCKYHVTWSAPSICESTSGASFTVTLTNKSDNSPVANLPNGLLVESFVSLADGGCDDQSTHAGPNTGTALAETPAGSGVYVGPIAFDAPGLWTVRFHIREECTTALPDSPHGTVGFHITAP